MKGVSQRNHKYMPAFAEAWPGAEFVQQAVAQLPWVHLSTLPDKLRTREERDWYLTKAVHRGGGQDVAVLSNIDNH